MAFNSIGDLVQSLALQRQSNVLKQRIERLTGELSTGMTTDVTKHLSGDFADLSDVESKLIILDSRRRIAEQGRVDSDVMQKALEQFQTRAQNLENIALGLGTSGTALSTGTFAEEARSTLGAMLSALNTGIGGRALFAGDDVVSSALSSFEDFMTSVRASVTGAASASDLTAALDAFFDAPGGGFETFVYQGGSSARAAYPLGEGESVTLDLRADNPAFRAMLKQATTAAFLDDPSVTLSMSDKADLTARVGAQLLIGQTALTDIRASLGFAESRIDRAATRISAEMSGLSMIRNNLLSIDPFEAATELETVQLRLETLYTLTSRMSRLNLVNFLS